MRSDNSDDVPSAIAESLACADYGAALAAGGITTAALNAHGQLVANHSDGSSTLLGEEEEDQVQREQSAACDDDH